VTLAPPDMGRFKDTRYRAIKGEVHCPVRVPVRGIQSLCPGFARGGARRQERAIAGMAAEAVTSIGPAAEQRAGRISQLHDLRRARPMHVFDARK